MWITVRRRAARQHDFEQPNRFIYFAELKKIGVFCVEKIENYSRLGKMHGVFYENCGIYVKIHRKLAAFPRKSENPQIAENRDSASR